MRSLCWRPAGLDEALGTVTQIVAWLDENPNVVDPQGLKRLFVCYRVLAAAGGIGEVSLEVVGDVRKG